MKPIRLLLFMSLLSSAAYAQDTSRVEVFKSPACGCCSVWIKHLRQNGFEVISHDVSDLPDQRKKLGMPERFGSCHSSKIGAYVIEGHVPATDIQRLLKQKPQAVGLAVPSMPPGSPGMEGSQAVPYDTLLVNRDGNASVFTRH